MRPLLAIGMVLLVAAPWYIAVGVKTDGAFLREFFLTHNLDRATGSMEGHRGPPWYYPLAMLVGLFPWSIFAVPLALETCSRLRFRDKDSDGYLLATCWICVWVGIFSIAKTKLPSYVTPCYPAVALLAGCFVHHMQQGTLRVHRYWLPASFATLAAAGIGMMIGIPLAAEKFLPGEGWLGILGAIPLFAGILAGLAWYWQRASWPAPLVAAAGGLVVVGILALGAARADLHRHDQQMVVEWIRSRASKKHLSAYGVLEPSWVYYSRELIPELPGKPSAAARLLESHPAASLVTKEELIPAIARELDGELEIVFRAPHFLQNERLVILRLRPQVEIARAPQGKNSAH